MIYVYRVYCEGTVARALCKGCAEETAADVRADYPDLEVHVEIDPVMSRHNGPGLACSGCGNFVRRTD